MTAARNRTLTPPRPTRAGAVAAARDALLRLAHDLRWTWHDEARALFHDLDPDAWDASGHNPERLLARLPEARLAKVLGRDDFAARLAAVTEEFAAMQTSDLGWFPEHHPGLRMQVAVFAAEFGLADALPISAGGLGAVAGEQLKTAGELGVPMTGVGLRYTEASHQWLDREGRQHETWEPLLPADLPLDLVRDRAGGFPLEVRVPFPEYEARARVWEVAVGRSRLLLVDADAPGNPAAARAITRRLYPTEPELRLRQYLLLGLGGYDALAAQRIEPDVVHCNEGHSPPSRTSAPSCGAATSTSAKPVSRPRRGSCSPPTRRSRPATTTSRRPSPPGSSRRSPPRSASRRRSSWRSAATTPTIPTTRSARRCWGCASRATATA